MKTCSSNVLVCKWKPGKQHRVITNDETSVHVLQDVHRKFKYVSRKGAAHSSVDAATPQFCASVQGTWTAAGGALGPMIVTQGTYKVTSGCTATGTVTLDGELQKAVWSTNQKGSFDEVRFIEFTSDYCAYVSGSYSRQPSDRHGQQSADTHNACCCKTVRSWASSSRCHQTAHTLATR